MNKGLFQKAVTFIEKPLTAVNIQGAWTWRSKPFSGFIEYSHNGLGLEEVDGSMALPEILSRRLQRRQFFNTGTDYLGAGLSTQWTALLTVSPTLLVNIRDRSGIALFSGQWNASNNDNIVFGIQIHFGSNQTEYGSPGNRAIGYVRWERFF